MSFIQTYFLRVYSIERRKGGQDDAAVFREALFQTRFLAFLPPFGLASAAIVAVGRLSSPGMALLLEYRTALTIALVAAMFVVAFVVVGRAVRKIGNIPTMADQHSSSRDRVLCHLQFWCTGLLSLAIPFVVALLLPEVPLGHGG